MTFLQAILGLVLLSPGDGGGSTPDQYIQQALESPNRLEADLEKDANRHPEKVLEFFGFKPGMDVLDLFSGGGYYTTIVSSLVGKEGSVTAHNNPAYIAFVDDELKQRYAEGKPANVVDLISEANELEFAQGKFDAALAILTWHDFYYIDLENNWPKIDAAGMVENLCHALKPGAVLGVVDHVAAPGGDVWETAQTLHRIDPARIKSDLEGSCFEFEAEAEFLRNTSDDYNLPMFDQKVRGKTDRVVYRYRHK